MPPNRIVVDNIRVRVQERVLTAMLSLGKPEEVDVNLIVAYSAMRDETCVHCRVKAADGRIAEFVEDVEIFPSQTLITKLLLIT